ncbi:hypothetical protein SDC9_159308 [bioreactor metagenome]|uniref:Uncharacterized protein n=1 Tax=bioreactor metagenome TaxID=1076179 RepID=A0A645FC99_9ZZZZ
MLLVFISYIYIIDFSVSIHDQTIDELLILGCEIYFLLELFDSYEDIIFISPDSKFTIFILNNFSSAI